MRKIIFTLTILMIVSAHLLQGQTGGFSTDIVLPDFFRSDTTKFFNRFPNNQSDAFLSSYIFSEVDMSSNKLLAANVRFTEKDQVYKFSAAPFRLVNYNFGSKLLQIAKENLKLSGTLSKTNLALGGSIGFDTGRPRGKRAKKYRSSSFASLASWDNIEPKDLYLQRFNKAKADYLYNLNKMIWTGSVGFTQKIFPTFGSKVDSPDSTHSYRDTSNYYNEKGKTLSLSGTCALNRKKYSQTFTAATYYSIARQNAQKEVGAKQVPYVGFSLGTNYRIMRLLPDDKRAENDNYLKTGFIPAIYMGATYEYQKALADAKDYRYIEDAVRIKSVITPNIDFCISPTTQFRIGIPIIKSYKVNGSSEIGAGATVQVSFQLSNLLD